MGRKAKGRKAARTKKAKPAAKARKGARSAAPTRPPTSTSPATSTKPPTPAAPGTEAATKPKRKGRQRAALPAYDGQAFGLEEEDVHQVPLDKLDLLDQACRFRVELRPEALVDSIKSHGVQMALVVRPHPKLDGRYQLVCGFRRAYAAQAAGLTYVPVVVRELTDEQAYVLSYVENDQRKTFGDVDRAVGIHRLKEMGKTSDEVGKLYRLGPRQTQSIEALLDYPQVLRSAVEDAHSGVSLAHALCLMQARRRLGAGFDLAAWVSRASREKLSYHMLRKALRETTPARGRPRSLIRRRGNTITFDLGAILRADPERRNSARKELHEILAKMGG